ncbi:MAG: hypothetical protein ACRD1D_10785 [Acidimicrobiales bacterium]
MASLPANGRRRAGRRTAAPALAALLGATLVAGCGGGSSEQPSNARATDEAPTAASGSAPTLPADQAQKQACSLVTEADVEAAVGARVNAGRQENQEGRSLCAFDLASASDQSVALISTSSSGVPAAFAEARRGAEGAQAVNAGDEAFVRGGQALVRKGDTMVVILVALRRDQTQLSGAATRLAQSVGARL